MEHVHVSMASQYRRLVVENAHDAWCPCNSCQRAGRTLPATNGLFTLYDARTFDRDTKTSSCSTPIDLKMRGIRSGVNTIDVVFEAARSTKEIESPETTDPSGTNPMLIPSIRSH